MARLGGLQLVEGKVAVKHQDIEGAAGNREGFGSFTTAGVDADAHAVGPGFVIDIQGDRGDEEVELIDGGFGGGVRGTTAEDEAEQKEELKIGH